MDLMDKIKNIYIDVLQCKPREIEPKTNEIPEFVSWGSISGRQYLLCSF